MCDYFAREKVDNYANIDPEHTFDEMQRKLSAVVNVVKKNIQQKLDTEQWHSTLNSIIDFFGIGNIKAKFPAYKQGTYFMNVKRVISMGHTIFHCLVVPKQLHDRHKELNDRQWSESSRCGCKIKAFANL